VNGFHSQIAVLAHNWAKDGAPRVLIGELRIGHVFGLMVALTHGAR
jgi:hypothetical protein